MNTRIKLILTITLFTIACAVTVYHARAQADKPVTLTELQKKTLELTDTKLKMLQDQFQAQAKPIADEQLAVLTQVCAQVKAKPGVDCEVNIQTGVVAKKATTSPSAGSAPSPAPSPSKK